MYLIFYNQRRRQLIAVSPNKAHYALSKLEVSFHVTVVTQNVDDLHERAGSSNVLHLHGELLKARSTRDENLVYPWKEDINTGDLCEKNSQLRPHIVWFGEAVPLLEKAVTIVAQADVLMIIGTSMQVYPAAGLIDYAKQGVPIYFMITNPRYRKTIFPI